MCAISLFPRNCAAVLYIPPPPPKKKKWLYSMDQELDMSFDLKVEVVWDN